MCLVYLLDNRYLVSTCNTEFFKSPYRRQYPRFHGTNCLIVCTYSLFKIRADTIKMLNKCIHPFIQLTAQFANLLCILCKLFLPPSVGNRPQQSDEGGWRCNNNPLFNTILYNGIVHITG